MHNFYSFIERATPPDVGRELLATDGGRSVAWAELHAQTARLSRLLTGFGLARGDRVAAQVEKSPEALFLYLACLRAGLTFLPINTAYQRSELNHLLTDAQPHVVVCDPRSEPLMRGLAPQARMLTLDEAGQGSLTERSAHQPAQFGTVEVESSDLACIVYTSGTTGRSKGAMLTHRNLVSNGQALVQTWGFSANDVLLHALPIFHIHGLQVATHCVLLSGARMLWHRKFDVAALLRDLPRATVLMGVPTFYTRLLAEPRWSCEHCRRIRVFISGSAPLLADTFRVFEDRTGQVILERYGMSEAGIITSNPLNGKRKAGTVGMPLPGVSVRVTGEGDRPLPLGEAGGIQIRAESVFAGYWQLPEKTAEEFTADGWFRTGDIGCFDAQGYLSIVGRAKDLIISGGYNVYPKEIELAIDQLPRVLESAVIGVPHPDFGEAVVAAVVTKNGCALSDQAIVSALKRDLAAYKVPKCVFLVGELPRNAMGKVQKNVLRERYADTFAARPG